MEKKWTKLNFLIIPIAVLAFILYISSTSDSASGFETLSPEGRLEQALSEIEGVGKVKVYFHYDENPSKSNETLSNYFRSTNQTTTISGLLIVSEGAKNPAIQRQLLETVSKVMQMPAHRIMIVPMESKGDEQ
ncbi:hypothetical protein ACFPN4_01575 [Ureibacillus thermophilus]|uniref:Stage III sporulation protein AG n=1 Tax=Ureibacillus thermophilus TaxID=367743 RepID=A0A4P6USM5_9BACL|nr:hypothetical protein [Ureibacillus thermophilus]QBK26084.1 hypothetical protein DKZ56_09515 [Ureibacillus thermophilus]